MGTPVVGVKAKVTLKKGTDPEIVLKNSKYSLEKDPNVKEAHNAVDGTRRVAGRKDGTGSVEGWQNVNPDDGEPGTIQEDIEDGDIVELRLYEPDGTDAPTKFWKLNAIIGKLKISTGVDDLYGWSFDFALAFGVITKPVGTAPAALPSGPGDGQAQAVAQEIDPEALRRALDFLGIPVPAKLAPLLTPEAAGEPTAQAV